MSLLPLRSNITLRNLSRLLICRQSQVFYLLGQIMRLHLRAISLAVTFLVPFLNVCLAFDKLKTSTARIIQKKSRHFQPDWLEKNGWLSYCKTENKVYCQTCRYVVSAGLKKAVDAHGANAFMSKGFTNWRTASEQFSQHAKSCVTLITKLASDKAVVI